ncbi:hypothetical protein FOCC_FOCC000774 [Frankliniella occidentalis]|nr:hypothetical protein FOCC_FOCC000774 [Frankliniella occidentalis]
MLFDLDWPLDLETGSPSSCRLLPAHCGMWRRDARQEEREHVRLLSGTVRGCDVHHTDPAQDAILFLQPHRALRTHQLHGSSRVHSATRLRGEAHPRRSSGKQGGLIIIGSCVMVGVVGAHTNDRWVTILLSLTVFLNMVAESMPTTSDAVPLIGMVISNWGAGVSDTWRQEKWLSKVQRELVPKWCTVPLPYLYPPPCTGFTLKQKGTRSSLPIAFQVTPKILTGVTILLSLTVFLNLVAESMPVTSDAVPLIGRHYGLLGIFGGCEQCVTAGMSVSGVTILLSLTVFLNLVAETLPQVSDAIPLLVKLFQNHWKLCLESKPLIATLELALPKIGHCLRLFVGTYFNCIMFMVASSVVLTVVVLNFHHRTADIHEMPGWVKKVFLLWLPWILCMSRPGRKITRKQLLMSSRMKELELKERSSKSLLANVLDIDDDFRRSHGVPGVPNSAAFMRTASTLEDASSGSPACPVAARDLQFITNRMKKNDEEMELINDWKFAAMVVDRFCLIIFTVFTIIATVAVLLSAPHIIVQ